MQDPFPIHQDNDTRDMPSWYQRFRMGPLGPMGLCAIALGFIALLISGRLRMLYPMPRTVVASPQAEPVAPTPQRTVGPGKAGGVKAAEPKPAGNRFETPPPK